MSYVACAKCQKWTHPRSGLILCAVNGKDIRENVAAGACPEGRFCLPIVRAPLPVPDGMLDDYAPTPANATAGGCGCAGDQQHPSS